MKVSARRELAASTFVATALMFVLGKYVAHAFGPAGAGYQGGFNSAVTVAATLALFGTTASIPAYAANFGQPRSIMLSRVVRLLSVTVVAAIPFLVLLVAPVLNPTFSLGVLVPASILALLAAAATPVSRTLLSVFRSPREVALQQVVYSLASVSATIGLLNWSGLTFLPLSLAGGMVVGQTLATLVVRIWGSRQEGEPVALKAQASSRPPALVVYSFAYFVTAACGQLAFAAIPYVVLAIAGAEVAGFFRSGLSISLAAYGVLYTSVVFSLYPRLASSESAQEQVKHLSTESRAILKWGSVGAVCIATSAPLLLWLAFSAEFLVGSSCLAFLAVASVPRLLISVNTVTLMSSGRRRGMLVTELTAGLLVLAGSSVGATLQSETAIGFAFLVSSLSGLIVAELTTRRLTSLSALHAVRKGSSMRRWSGVLGLVGLVSAFVWALIFGG